MSQQGRILGIGGIFFKSANQQQMKEWYGKHLGLSDSGHLYWIKRLKEGGQLQYKVSPGTTFLQRAGVWFISLLPIDWLL